MNLALNIPTNNDNNIARQSFKIPSWLEQRMGMTLYTQEEDLKKQQIVTSEEKESVMIFNLISPRQMDSKRKSKALVVEKVADIKPEDKKSEDVPPLKSIPSPEGAMVSERSVVKKSDSDKSDSETVEVEIHPPKKTMPERSLSMRQLHSVRVEVERKAEDAPTMDTRSEIRKGKEDGKRKFNLAATLRGKERDGRLEADERVRVEGYVSKKRAKFWNKRYLVCTDRQLIYWKTMDDFLVPLLCQPFHSHIHNSHFFARLYNFHLTIAFFFLLAFF